MVQAFPGVAQASGSTESLVSGTNLPSRLREFHPEALTDSGREPLDSSGSCHRVETAVSRQDRRFLPFPVALPILSSVTHPLRSTGITLPHRYYGVVRPWLAHPYCRPHGFPACAFSVTIAHQVSQVPYESPNEIHAAYTPDTAWSAGRYPPCSFPGQGDAPGFDVI